MALPKVFTQKLTRRQDYEKMQKMAQRFDGTDVVREFSAAGRRPSDVCGG